MWDNFKPFFIKQLIKFSQKIKYIKNEVLIEKLKKKELVSIGKHTYGKFFVDSYEGSEAKLTIGKYCSISLDVRFITGGIHPVDWVSLYPFRIKWGLEGLLQDGMPATKGPIIVENDVWIGTKATILSGVVIGNGAIVMAGAVVTKDVAPYSIVGGIPAKEVKKRFSEEVISKMLQIKWWEWEEKKIQANVDLISSIQVESFINKHYVDK